MVANGGTTTRGETATVSMKIGGGAAVSYTHLDVYKRQESSLLKKHINTAGIIYRLIKKIISPFKLLQQQHTPRTFDNNITQEHYQIDISRSGTSLLHIPVSYTHLYLKIDIIPML